MKLGFIGLGRMGYNMTSQLVKKHSVVIYDLNQNAVRAIARKGGIASNNYEDLLSKLPKQKIIWLMIPQQFVDETIKKLLPKLKRGDIIIDGGNSHYTDTITRGKKLKKKGIYLVDVGTSGGLEGAANGACFMAGCEKKVWKTISPILASMAVKGGYGYMGGPGTGHLVKMVHNGIEYGMMEAIGEGFEILESSKEKINLREVARVWTRGSVIRSWLMELAEEAFRKDLHLKVPSGRVDQLGEGYWTVLLAKKLNILTPVISAAVNMRNASKKCQRFSGKVVAMLRYGFGRHSFEKKKGAKNLKKC